MVYFSSAKGKKNVNQEALIEGKNHQEQNKINSQMEKS